MSLVSYLANLSVKIIPSLAAYLSHMLKWRKGRIAHFTVLAHFQDEKTRGQKTPWRKAGQSHILSLGSGSCMEPSISKTLIHNSCVVAM